MSALHVVLPASIDQYALSVTRRHATLPWGMQYCIALSRPKPRQKSSVGQTDVDILSVKKNAYNLMPRSTTENECRLGCLPETRSAKPA